MFSGRTFATFVAMTAGLVAAPTRHMVCGMLMADGMGDAWHHSRAHRFFATAVWNLDHVGLVMLALMVG